MKLQPALYYSHTLLNKVVKPGDTVVDATVGNGNDTKFLADLVGRFGTVYGFDIQSIAIQNTNELLTQSHLNDSVKLFQIGHEHIDEVVPTNDNIQAAIFNLGYLPGGDHHQITNPQTTLTALKSCLKRLNKGGMVVMVLYYGHPGGQVEKETVLNFAQSLNQKQFTVLDYQFINQANQPPILLAIQKR
ncbi:tRNA (mnm(5)s(2)U34)-methyltransferase [Lactobacillaceae bacterium Melli_B4]